jgi:Mg-chelatase subunit ChlI
MKIKLLLSASIFLISLSNVFAQSKPEKSQKSPKERASGLTTRLEKILNLDTKQKNVVFDANLEAATNMDALKAKLKTKEIDRSSAMEQKSSIRSIRDSKISAVLNEEQKAKFEQFKAKQKEKGKSRNKKAKGGKDKKSKDSEQQLDELDEDSDM